MAKDLAAVSNKFYDWEIILDYMGGPSWITGAFQITKLSPAGAKDVVEGKLGNIQSLRGTGPACGHRDSMRKNTGSFYKQRLVPTWQLGTASYNCKELNLAKTLMSLETQFFPRAPWEECSPTDNLISAMRGLQQRTQLRPVMLGFLNHETVLATIEN